MGSPDTLRDYQIPASQVFDEKLDDAILYKTGRDAPFVMIEERDYGKDSPHICHVGRGLTIVDIMAEIAEREAKDRDTGHGYLTSTLSLEYWQGGHQVGFILNMFRAPTMLAGEVVAGLLMPDGPDAGRWRFSSMGKRRGVRIVVDLEHFDADDILELAEFGIKSTPTGEAKAGVIVTATAE